MNYYYKHYEIYSYDKQFNEKKISKFFYYMLDKYGYNRSNIFFNISRNKDIIHIRLNKIASKKEHDTMNYIINNLNKYLSIYYNDLEICYFKNKFN